MKLEGNFQTLRGVPDLLAVAEADCVVGRTGREVVAHDAAFSRPRMSVVLRQCSRRENWLEFDGFWWI